MANRNRLAGYKRRAIAAPLSLLAASLLAVSLPSRADIAIGWSTDLGYNADNNVNRGVNGGEKLRDSFWSYGLTAGTKFPITPRTRLVVSAFANGEHFHTYSGLSHVLLGAQGEYQFRLSGRFAAPTFGAYLRAASDSYQSYLRDSYRQSVGLTWRQSLTDRISTFAALAANRRDGRSEVFDNRDASVRANLDWTLTRQSTLYLGAEYRKGDIVSTGLPSLATVDAAKAIVVDDVFSDATTTRYAYKLDGKTALFTLGANFSFGIGHALDLSWRRVQSRASYSTFNSTTSFGTNATGSATLYYNVSQFSLAYLYRF